MMQNEICCGGNIKLGIHGKMNCSSGKRMKKRKSCIFSIRTGIPIARLSTLWALHEYGIQKWRWIYSEDRVISNLLPKDGTVNYYCKIVKY